MIDLHCHLLDSAVREPQLLKEAVEMCREAVAEGIHTLVATPHWDENASVPPVSPSEMAPRVEALTRETAGALTIKTGFSVRFTPSLPELVSEYGPALALGGGRHILVSFPTREIPASAEETWDVLSDLGYGVVIAHPECHLSLRRNGGRLAGWVAQGAVLQIDAASVTGHHGREIKRFALQCIRDHAPNVVVASNASNTSTRPFRMREAANILDKNFGPPHAKGLVNEWPGRIIGGQTVAESPSPRESIIQRVSRGLKVLREQISLY